MADRALKFRDNAKSLNEQFSKWVGEQLKNNPEKLLSAGAADYLRHCAKLRLQYADIVLPEQEEEQNEKMEKKRGVSLLSLAPLTQTKTIHFIRHGEGFHNIGIANMDARLTRKGWTQANSLGIHAEQHDATAEIQLVVTSPLTRALETAAGAFGSSKGTKILMNSQECVPNSQEAQGPIFIQEGKTYIVHESCRERLGPSSCDARRSRDELEVSFPGVDFSLLPSGPDPFWKENSTEKESAVVARGQIFLDFIMRRPETNIAVVTHSAFLWFTLANFGNEMSKSVREKIQRWYENGEMRSLCLTDGGTLNSVDSLHFVGGEALSEPQQELISKD
eukprot:jgi/Picsp_1/1799/NSC_05267-R1_phosphoglycerate mutase-like protein